MDPLAWLFSLEQFGIKLGLESMAILLEALHQPDAAFTSVHVAGTNGKGSVTAMVDAALRAAGHRSARYTSPHLVDLTERFAIDGHAVARDDLAQVVEHIRQHIDALRRTGRLAVQPTFFEVTTAAAFELFRRAGVDVAVCEVGLGGRLDATNALRPVVSAITTVGFDHVEHLGSTLSAIAREKAGIIKMGVPVVVGRVEGAARSEIFGQADRRGAPAIDAIRDVAVESVDGNVRLHSPTRTYGPLRLGLEGRHQLDNACVSVRILELLDDRGIHASVASVSEGLATVRWPGRLEWRRFADGREALLDAAHNADGATALARYLTDAGHTGLPLVFGASGDKDIDAILLALIPVIGSVVCTRAATPRAAEPAMLAARARTLAPHLDVVTEQSLMAAITRAWGRSRRIVVAGSIFLLGDVIKSLEHG